MKDRRVIIDTDPGIDDALALILAFRSPELKVEAITTVNGNVPLEDATRNALQILEVLDLPEPPPVACGAARPIVREPLTARHVHGEDGLGDIAGLTNPGGSPRYPRPTLSPVGTSAADLILSLLNESPGEISIIALGPLTNIALALESNPAAFSQVQEVIVMGGAVNGIGNVTETAEFNFYADPGRRLASHPERNSHRGHRTRRDHTPPCLPRQPSKQGPVSAATASRSSSPTFQANTSR